MPRYRFQCGTCFAEWEDVCAVADCTTQVCPTDGQPASVVFWTRETAPATQSPRLDNQYYNNGLGGWDEGLGVHVRSRGHREQLMQAQGVRPLERDEAPHTHPGPVHDPIAGEQVADWLERAEARVRAQDVPPPSALPPFTVSPEAVA